MIKSCLKTIFLIYGKAIFHIITYCGRIVVTRVPDYRESRQRQQIHSHFYSKTNKMHQCIKFILLWNDTLHVSEVIPSIIRSSSNRHLSNRHCCLLVSSQAVRKPVCYIHHCCVYSTRLLTMDRGTVRNMKSFIPKTNLRN
jgi:hypothetical protein